MLVTVCPFLPQIVISVGDSQHHAAVLSSLLPSPARQLHLLQPCLPHTQLLIHSFTYHHCVVRVRGAKPNPLAVTVACSYWQCHPAAAMSPGLCSAEILLDGRVSKAADVYAFGVTLWEMYTGRRAFEGVPRALLGHQITKVRKAV